MGSGWEILLEAAERLPDVHARRMFGHDTLSTRGEIFALVDGERIGLKLTDPGLRAEALAFPGSTPFDPMGRGKGMGNWVVLGADVLDDGPALREWVRRAHALAMKQSG